MTSAATRTPSSGLMSKILRSQSVRPSTAADCNGRIPAPADVCVYYNANTNSVPIIASRKREPDSFSNRKSDHSFQRRLLSRSPSERKHLIGIKENDLFDHTERIFSKNRSFSTSYHSLSKYEFKMKENRGNTTSFKNGIRKSDKKRSRRLFIAEPPSYDGALNDLEMMQSSFRSYRGKTFCQQMRIFCQRSTLHGLSDLCRAENWWLRMFWLVTFSGAVAAAVYGCYHILEQYMESPVVVSYFVQESEMTFALPDLVVCPFNRFNAEFLKNYSIPPDVAQHMQLVFGMSAKHPAQRRELHRYMTPKAMAELDLAMNLTLGRLNMTFDDFIEAASLKCTDFFVDCAFPTGPVECCNDISGVMTFAGKCFRIRGVNQSGPGYGYGMTIVISLPKSLYSLAVNNWLNDGILVKLAEPNQGIDYDMTFIPVGTHALMPLKATKYEFMDDPPRFECLTEASVNYSRVDCFDQCFLEAAQNHCRCAMVGNRNHHNLPLCTTSQFYNCMFAYLSKQFEASQDAEHYFFGCRQRCKPRCMYWQYQSAVSYSKFPSEEARAFAKSDDEWIRMKNTIILDLYYEKLEFTRIKHHRSMTVHGFIANLGGQYSLWLGGSILTLMQFFVFFCNYGLGLCRHFLAYRPKCDASTNTGARIDLTYTQPLRTKSIFFWRKRRKSGSISANMGPRRHSTLSDDLHPQIQALTQLNHPHTNLRFAFDETSPFQTNGTCVTSTNIDESTGTGFGLPSAFIAPSSSSSNNDIARMNKTRGLLIKDKGNGKRPTRSPSAELNHSRTARYAPGRGERSPLDGIGQRHWTSET